MKKSEPRMSFRAVEVFVAIVEEGSVTGAARRLGASASSVSQQLTNLESYLGARLIERSARSFMLTTAGERFRERAQHLLDEVSSARASLSDFEKAQPMTFRIASIEDLDAYVVPEWLGRLEDGLADSRFVVQSGPSHINYTALANRSADMIVAADAADPVDWVEEHAVLRDPYVLIQAGPEKMQRHHLQERQFIRYSRDQYMGRQIEAQMRRTGVVPERRLEFSSTISIVAAVAKTNGWAITTALSALSTPLNPERVTIAPLPIPAFSRSISLYARRGSLGLLPGRFAQTLREVLAEETVSKAVSAYDFLQGEFRILPV